MNTINVSMQSAMGTPIQCTLLDVETEEEALRSHTDNMMLVDAMAEVSRWLEYYTWKERQFYRLKNEVAAMRFAQFARMARALLVEYKGMEDGVVE